MPSACVIKAVMHHQYRPNNLERLYGAQHYTYGYKVQLLLRALGRLGRCQGVLSPKKGHLGPKTGFPLKHPHQHGSAHSSPSLYSLGYIWPTPCAFFGTIIDKQ